MNKITAALVAGILTLSSAGAFAALALDTPPNPQAQTGKQSTDKPVPDTTQVKKTAVVKKATAKTTPAADQKAQAKRHHHHHRHHPHHASKGQHPHGGMK